MKKQERMKWSKTLEKWVAFYMIAMLFIGAALGTTLVYIFQGTFEYEIILGAVAACTILLVVELVKRKRRTGNVPEADERVVRNISKLFAYSSHAALAILFIALGAFTLLGAEAFPILYLWILFFSYLWITGIGSIIIKRI